MKKFSALAVLALLTGLLGTGQALATTQPVALSNSPWASDALPVFCFTDVYGAPNGPAVLSKVTPFAIPGGPSGVVRSAAYASNAPGAAFAYTYQIEVTSPALFNEVVQFDVPFTGIVGLSGFTSYDIIAPLDDPTFAGSPSPLSSFYLSIGTVSPSASSITSLTQGGIYATDFPADLSLGGLSPALSHIFGTDSAQSPGNRNATIFAFSGASVSVDVVAPIPEPATLLLLGSGLVGLGAGAWRRRATRQVTR